VPGVSSAPEFSVTAEEHDGRAVVRVAGEVDVATVGEVERVLREQLDQGPVVLDLAQLEFIDSTGIRLLDALVREDVALTLRPDLQPAVRQVFDMTGLAAELTFEQG